MYKRCPFRLLFSTKKLVTWNTCIACLSYQFCHGVHFNRKYIPTLGHKTMNTSLIDLSHRTAQNLYFQRPTLTAEIYFNGRSNCVLPLCMVGNIIHFLVKWHLKIPFIIMIYNVFLHVPPCMCSAVHTVAYLILQGKENVVEAGRFEVGWWRMSTWPSSHCTNVWCKKHVSPSTLDIRPESQKSLDKV